MSEQQQPDNRPAVEQGAYELIRRRLEEQGGELFAKAKALNEQREASFGSTRMEVVGSARIRTENNCVPRDINHVAGQLIFGFNVFIGLKKETRVQDVFSLHALEQAESGYELKQLPLAGSFLDDHQFRRDFEELYKYYKESSLTHLRVLGGKLLAVFRTGRSASDVKVFRWGIDPDGKVTYIDNRGERDNVFPSSHDFEWQSTGREDYIDGAHPHVSIEEQVFVDAIGGNLTVKVENNTQDGLGIYREPVEEPDQSLSDARIEYAMVGSLILLKVLPYRENEWRYLVYDARNQTVTRIDAIGQACLQLPEDHGIIFPGGYYLLSGGYKTFEADIEDLEVKRIIKSPNGEDVIYVFHHLAEGRMMLLSYNLISKELQNPIHCHGYSLYDDGRMVLFRYDSDEHTRVHPMQVWQTPYYSDEYAAARPKDTSFLGRIGNADLVRGISDAYSIQRMIREAEPSMVVYEDLIAAAGRMVDDYHWLGHEEAGDLLGSIKEIQGSAELVLGEFEKVQALRQQANKALAEAEAQQEQLIASLRPDHWKEVGDFVGALAELRGQRGHLITLRDLRYVDLARIDELEAETVERFDWLSQLTVEFLLQEDALAPYFAAVEQHEAAIEQVEKRVDVEPIDQALTELGDGLDLLNEVLAALKIEDATQRTRIIENISEVYALLNRTKATLDLKRKSLGSAEARLEFGAQFKLFAQSVTSALGLVDTPEKADEQLTRLLVQLEELESRFSEFDEFLGELASKREDVYEAFESRKQALLEERQRRAQNLAKAAERILTGVSRRSQGFKEIDQLNTYFATDPMILKLRDLVAQLRELGDSVRADDLEGQIKAARDQAGRTLRDRLDIFEGDGDVIRLGTHRFSVNTQAMDLTLLPLDEGLTLHLTGSDFMQPLEDEGLAAYRECWEQELPSETAEVYRGEYLAAAMLFDAEAEESDLSLQGLLDATREEDGLLEAVRKYAAPRYDEGYERGVHDADAAAILGQLLELYGQAGLLRYPARSRTLAQLFWAFFPEQERRGHWERVGRSLGQLSTIFGGSVEGSHLAAELAMVMQQLFSKQEIDCTPDELALAGRYLLEELKQYPPSFTTAAGAEALAQGFLEHLESSGQRTAFEDDLRHLEGQLGRRFRLISAWLEGFHQWQEKNAKGTITDREAIIEATGILLAAGHLERTHSSAGTRAEVTGLFGQHPRIEERTLAIHLDEFLGRLHAYRNGRVPKYRAYRELRQQVLEREKEALRLEEFKPQALTTFVRNRLIDTVYLPLVGDNLAKQMGALGAGKRTDQMGMLLLISPPGYGKTTLMEYMANRLGLVFMKINCPAVGHDTTAIDPAAAPNATARQELEKLNLGLEMGNNVMLYLDDIQHTNPEFLQKFISLADAQRKIEGVWRGRTRTYDLRGKKFCVIMAGNPYTESGEAFQIPDMLANRADIYNLGDVLGGKEEAFAMSYIENALTSNAVLAPLANRELDDVYRFVRTAKGEEVAATDFAHSYSATERNEIVGVIQKLLRVQQVVLKVNLQYISSAAQQDAYRTEPPFKLQGSYRNMNKMAEKVVAIMNDQELEEMIDDHYRGEAQTLTTGAEENLLKLGDLRGTLEGERLARWEEIKKGYRRIQASGGDEADPATRVVNQLSGIALNLEGLQQGIGQHFEQSRGSHQDELRQLGALLQQLQTSLEQAEMNVQVVNQPVPGMQLILEQLTRTYDETLLPLMKSLHHKLSLDDSIWRHVSETHQLLKQLDRRILDEGTRTEKKVRPLGKKPTEK